MPKTDPVKQYLAEIGRKGGKAPSPFKQYDSAAERQRAYRKRKKEASERAKVAPHSED